MKLTSLATFLLASVPSVLSATLQARAKDVAVDGKWKNHDDIHSLPAEAASGSKGELQLRFQPFIKVLGGCVPFPAVDAEGFLGAGLKPTGKGNGDCGSSEGQLYVRTGTVKERTGIMYSFYVPKVNKEHRHYWASIVVWVYGAEVNTAQPVGISYQTDNGVYNVGSYPATKWSSGASLVGRPTHPLVAYWGKKIVGPLTENMENTLNLPLIDWDMLPEPAQKQLDGAIFEHTSVPFIDKNFGDNLNKAFDEGFYADLPGGDGDEDGGDPTDPEPAGPMPSKAPPAPTASHKPLPSDI
ncbi:necrosis inducing protein [Colletotrichum simmondsii]|uniref:Necrosis inducing protein n=1 Tax=Colletotrichum simmondsii TaxID=703756 RepID=A0A135S5P9_9PEZI|nr:necrosis inducing protein [Colletotrichum simmondsii]